MEVDDSLPPPACLDVAMNITDNVTLIDDGPRLCPLCNSILKLFFICYDIKFLMCENVRCVFPFGCENLQVVQLVSDMEADVEIASLLSRPTLTSQVSGSIGSAAEWMDIEKYNVNSACDSEDTQSTISLSYSKSKRINLEELKKTKEIEEGIKDNVNKIKELNQILYNNEHPDHNNIRNKDWIKSLYKIQEGSGVQLLNTREVEKLKSNELSNGELTIDVYGKNSLSSIKIELVKQSDAT